MRYSTHDTEMKSRVVTIKTAHTNWQRINNFLQLLSAFLTYWRPSNDRLSFCAEHPNDQWSAVVALTSDDTFSRPNAKCWANPLSCRLGDDMSWYSARTRIPTNSPLFSSPFFTIVSNTRLPRGSFASRVTRSASGGYFVAVLAQLPVKTASAVVSGEKRDPRQPRGLSLPLRVTRDVFAFFWTLQGLRERERDNRLEK